LLQKEAPTVVEKQSGNFFDRNEEKPAQNGQNLTYLDNGNWANISARAQIPLPKPQE
jgi:hypothetical protein